jgi:type I restriction enzyme S subunit
VITTVWQCEPRDSSLACRKIPQMKFSKPYLYYLVVSPDFQSLAIGTKTGSAQPFLGLSQLRGHRIKYHHDIAIQRRIAGILSAYDELIENSQRRIKILESMARALYREWFIHFRFPGHASVPRVPSPLGEIPQGWEVKSLAELCTRMESGGTPKRGNPEYWENGYIDWYKTGELWDGFLFGSQEQITACGQRESTARLFEPGTILLAIYGSPTVGRMGLLTRHASCNQAALGLVADKKLISQTYLFFVLFSLREHFNSLAQGAAQQNISKAKVASALAVLPAREVLRSFDLSAESIFSQLQALQRQIQNLRRTRDLLLPRLLSGQIDVEALQEPSSGYEGGTND